MWGGGSDINTKCDTSLNMNAGNERKGSGKGGEDGGLLVLERCGNAKRISTRPNVNVELTARLEVQRRNRATAENTSALHATRHPSLRIRVVTVGMMVLKMASTYRGTHQGLPLEHFISA